MAKELMRTPVVEVQWCKLLGEPRINKFEPKKPPTWSIEIILDNSNPEHMDWVETIENKFDELHPGKKKSAHWCPVKPHKDEPRKKMTCRFKLPQFTFKDGNTTEAPTVFNKDGSFWPETQLIGNGKNIADLRKFLTHWNEIHVAGTHPLADAKGKDKPMKAVLISGPPGIGKSSAANIIAKACNLHVLDRKAEAGRCAIESIADTIANL